MTWEEGIRERLNFLIEKGLLSSDVLTASTGIEKASIENYLLGKINMISQDYTEQMQYNSILIGITDGLIEGMLVSEDERVKAIIDVLIQIYNMDYEMISGYTGLAQEEIVNFVNGNQDISLEKNISWPLKYFHLCKC